MAGQSLSPQSEQKPPATGPDSRRYFRSHLLSGLVALVAGAAFLAWRPVTDSLQLLALAWLTTPLLLARLPKLTRNLTAAYGVSMVNLAGLVTFLCAITGGLGSFLLPWFVIVPLEAAQVRRPAVLAIGALASALGLTLLAILHVSGGLPVPRVDLAQLSWLGAAGALTAVLYAGSVAAAILSMSRRSEQAAQAGEARYRFLADNALDLIMHHDADGRILYASPAAAALLGYAPDALPGYFVQDIAHREDRRLLNGIFSRAAHFGLPSAVEYRVVRPDGTDAWMEMTCRPAPAVRLPETDRVSQALRWLRRLTGRMDPDMTPEVEVISVTRDVGERKRIEAALVEARDAAEAANAAKTRFLAGMSHELRTPLNAIVGFSDCMREEVFGPVENAKYKEYAEHIHESGEHLKALIDDILDLSKIEAGKFELEPKIVSLPKLAETCMKTVRMAARSNDVTLELDLPPSLPPLWVDERAMRQILLNILSNAIKFTPAGGQVVTRARVVDDAYIVTVEDTGIGIPQAALDRLGQPFEQVEARERADLLKTYAQGVRGTGLGLAMVKALVDLHGGWMDIASEEGQGTRVSVHLPLGLRPSERAPADPGTGEGADIVPLAGYGEDGGRRAAG